MHRIIDSLLFGSGLDLIALKAKFKKSHEIWAIASTLNSIRLVFSSDNSYDLWLDDRLHEFIKISDSLKHSDSKTKICGLKSDSYLWQYLNEFFDSICD